HPLAGSDRSTDFGSYLRVETAFIMAAGRLAFHLGRQINYLSIRSHILSFRAERKPGMLSPEHRSLKGLVRSYESLCHRSYSQPCGHWTRRRREDATD